MSERSHEVCRPPPCDRRSRERARRQDRLQRVDALMDPLPFDAADVHPQPRRLRRSRSSGPRAPHGVGVECWTGRWCRCGSCSRARIVGSRCCCHTSTRSDRAAASGSGSLRFGVQFLDGRKATTMGGLVRLPHPHDQEPEGPALTQHGGGGSGSDWFATSWRRRVAQLPCGPTPWPEALQLHARPSTHHCSGRSSQT
jgi:hypothetical protein